MIDELALLIGLSAWVLMFALGFGVGRHSKIGISMRDRWSSYARLGMDYFFTGAFVLLVAATSTLDSYSIGIYMMIAGAVGFFGCVAVSAFIALRIESEPSN